MKVKVQYLIPIQSRQIGTEVRKWATDINVLMYLQLQCTSLDSVCDKRKAAHMDEEIDAKSV